MSISSLEQISHSPHLDDLPLPGGVDMLPEDDPLNYPGEDSYDISESEEATLSREENIAKIQDLLLGAYDTRQESYKARGKKKNRLGMQASALGQEADRLIRAVYSLKPSTDFVDSNLVGLRMRLRDEALHARQLRLQEAKLSQQVLSRGNWAADLAASNDD